MTNNFITIFTAQLLTGLLIIIGYFLFKNFLPGYFTEKGKNLATKEDISEITTQVESVKHSFAAENEKLKTSLLLISNIQSGLISEERNAIVDYNSKYSLWKHMLIDVYLSGVNDKRDQELKEYIRKIGECRNDLMKSQATFKLFINDQVLVDLANQLELETHNRFTTLIRLYIIKLETNNALQHLHEQKEAEFQTTEEQENLNTNRLEAFIKWQEELEKGYDSVFRLHTQFRVKCREYLYGLLEKKE